MKKLLILALVLVMTASVIVGCDKSDNGDTDPTATKGPTNTPVVTAEPTPTVEPTAAPTPEPGTNVALNKSYEVSSEVDSTYAQWGWASEFINDGIKENDPTSQGWTTNVKEFMNIEDWSEQYAMIDLGQVVSIDKVVLYPRQDTGAGFPCDYHIEVSTDNKEYKTVASKENDVRVKDQDFDPATLTFDAVDARYVKLVVTKPWPEANGNDGFLVQLAEFEIYSAPSGE